MLVLDGTEYFSSQIHCAHCCHRTHKNGTTTYFHTAVTPVLVAPGKPQLISLEPEFITPQDGHDKQDCENAAAKRWITSNHRREEDPPVTLLGDDLYCNQPICETVLEHGYHFIFVCKRSWNPELYDWVDYLEGVGEVQTLTQFEFRGGKRLSYQYRFVNGVPLRATLFEGEPNQGDSRAFDFDQVEVIIIPRNRDVISSAINPDILVEDKSSVKPEGAVSQTRIKDNRLPWIGPLDSFKEPCLVIVGIVAETINQNGVNL